MVQRYKQSIPILILLFTLLTACGGGGGNPPPPINAAPVASNVTIFDDDGGDTLAGDGLSARYTYSDAENDAEGASSFRWLRDGMAINGATGTTYRLVLADGGTEITFEVTPVAAAGTTTGTAATSVGITVAVVNVDLASLNITGADLEQAFDAAQTNYTAVVGFLIDAVLVDATAAAGSATIQVNGAALPGGGLSIDLAEGDNVITVTVSHSSSMRDYTLTVTRQTAAAFAQDVYLKASNGGTDDVFGTSVALSGDTLAVGAFGEASDGSDEANNSAFSAGAVYVFTRDGAGVWTQAAYLKAANAGTVDQFGWSVALSGDTLAVGAPAESSDGSSAANNSAGAAGAVYVFTRDSAGVWAQDAYLKASNVGTFDQFGKSVALSGDTLAVGADFEDGDGSGEADNSASRAGAVYVFTRDGAGGWAQDAYLKASNAGTFDQFGRFVALSDDTLAVGAFGESSDGSGEADNSTAGAGAVYVFTRDGAGGWAQEAYLKASNAGAFDLFGISVSLSGDTLAVGAFGEASDGSGAANNSASGAGAVYVFIRDGAGLWTQDAYLKASNAEADDRFGFSLALSGDTLSVGANLEDSDGSSEADNSASNAGAVYVFIRDGAGVWTQAAYLKATNVEAFDLFGISAALSGDTLVVGANGEDSDGSGEADNSAFAAGAVYLYGGLPTRTADLSSMSLDGVDLDQIFQPAQLDYSASVGFLDTSVQLNVPGANPNATVRVNGALVGADGIDVSLVEGANVITIEVTAEDGVTTMTYTLIVMRATAASFAQNAYLKAANAEAFDQFGLSVALSGDTMAVGATGEASNGSDEADNSAAGAGAVYVFTRDGAGMWALEAYLKASNVGAGDNFGWSVALSGDTLLLGAIGEDSDGSGEADNSASNAGAVYVFTRDSAGEWTQAAYLKAANAEVNDQFGWSVALSDDTLLIGAIGEASDGSGAANNSASGAGAVYVFIRDSAGVWLQAAYLKAANAEFDDQFGTSVALSGDTLAVGARLEASDGSGEANNSASGAGAVYLFTRDGAGAWTQAAYLKAANAGAGDLFGLSVALSGDTLAIGAFGEDSDGSGEANNSASAAGAVYVFTRDGAGVWTQAAYLKASNAEANDQFGLSVALSGGTLVVGANGEASDGSGEADNSASGAGAVYLFTRDGAGAWTQAAYMKASNAEANDQFGLSVALSGDTLAIGAFGEDSDGSGEANNSAIAAGAVYAWD